MLSQALRLHWLFAYLFMFNGLLYLVGLALSGGYRALLPRLTDMRDALSMIVLLCWPILCEVSPSSLATS